MDGNRRCCNTALIHPARSDFKRHPSTDEISPKSKAIKTDILSVYSFDQTRKFTMFLHGNLPYNTYATGWPEPGVNFFVLRATPGVDFPIAT